MIFAGQEKSKMPTQVTLRGRPDAPTDFVARCNGKLIESPNLAAKIRE